LPELDCVLAEIAKDVRALLLAPAVAIGNASPPPTPGVYMLSVGEDVMYVGEAKGGGGLRDRLLNKHLSGDDKHAIQRAYLLEFPDRRLRRAHIRKHVFARWHAIPDADRVSAVERVLICLCQPPWNMK
jgi:hypothetical protein